MTPSSGRSVCPYYTVTINATRQQHTIVDDHFHMVLSLQRLRLQQAYAAAAGRLVTAGWPIFCGVAAVELMLHYFRV